MNKPTNTTAKTKIQFPVDSNRKLGIIPRWIPVSLVFLVFMVIGIVGFSFQKGLEMITVYAPLINADTEIKLNVSVAHMWVEETLAGDMTKELEDIWGALDRADKNALAMLEGGKYAEQVIIPLEDVEIRNMMVKVIQELKEVPTYGRCARCFIKRMMKLYNFGRELFIT